MSVPPDKMPGLLHVTFQTARLFSQTGANVRDNVRNPGYDAKLSMGLQFVDSATSLPGMVSKFFGRVNLFTSGLQGGYDLVQGLRHNDTARMGSGMATFGLMGMTVFGAPVALASAATYGVANLVAPEKTRAMHEQIGRATQAVAENVKQEMAKPVSDSHLMFGAN